MKQFFLEALEHPNGEVRATAARLIPSSLLTTEDLSYLETLLKDSNPTVRGRVFRTIKMKEPDRAYALLPLLMGDESFEVIREVTLTLVDQKRPENAGRPLAELLFPEGRSLTANQILGTFSAINYNAVITHNQIINCAISAYQRFQKAELKAAVVAGMGYTRKLTQEEWDHFTSTIHLETAEGPALVAGIRVSLALAQKQILPQTLNLVSKGLTHTNALIREKTIQILVGKRVSRIDLKGFGPALVRAFELGIPEELHKEFLELFSVSGFDRDGFFLKVALNQSLPLATRLQGLAVLGAGHDPAMAHNTEIRQWLHTLFQDGSHPSTLAAANFIIRRKIKDEGFNPYFESMSKSADIKFQLKALAFWAIQGNDSRALKMAEEIKPRLKAITEKEELIRTLVLIDNDDVKALLEQLGNDPIGRVAKAAKAALARMG